MTEITVTKVSVTYVQPSLWRVTLNLLVTEDSTELINRDFSIYYRQGDTPAHMLELFSVAMQECIDIYKEEQVKEDLAIWPSFLLTLKEALEY